MDDWLKIPKDKAEKQELYGVDGWLLVLAFYLASVFLVTIIYQFYLFPKMYPATVTGISSDATLIRLVLFIDILTTAVVLFILFTKYNNFRLIATWLFSMKVVLSLLNAFYISMSKDNMLIFIYNGQQIIVLTAWIIYINQSQRVRLTYEHKISRYSFYQN